jgi:chloride channel 7
MICCLCTLDALVGCAGALAGLTRLTIAATVMLLEATGNMQYVLPLMLCVMSARFVGNMFNDAIQDMQISVKNLPFLEVDHSRTAFGPDGMKLTAGHVMCLQHPPLTIPPVVNVGQLIRTLRSNDETACLPIVDSTRGGVLVGTILRSTLCLLLKYRRTTFIQEPSSTHQAIDGNVKSDACETSSSGSKVVPWTKLREQYPHFLSVDDTECAVDESDQAKYWIDLRPYINAGPYVVHHNTSLARTYRLFRGMGLRHLCVVDFHNRVVGMITRKDLADEELVARANELLTKRTQNMNLDQGRGTKDGPNNPFTSMSLS